MTRGAVWWSPELLPRSLTDGVRLSPVLVRPIVVLGPERSGTSMVAEMIARWGAYVGEPHQLSAGDRHNPRGYWEYRPLWDLAERIGDFASGVSWWEEPFPDLVAAKARDPSFAAEARALINEMERPGRPWMWKDPALCHLLPFWAEFWRDPVFVLTVRHPLAIARSWHDFAVGSPRRATSTQCNLLRWHYMAMAALIAGENNDTVVFVEYEGLIANPHAHAEQLASALDKACETTTSAATVAAIAAVPDAGLRHHNPRPVMASTACSARSTTSNEPRSTAVRFNSTRAPFPCRGDGASASSTKNGRRWPTKTDRRSATARPATRASGSIDRPPVPSRGVALPGSS